MKILLVIISVAIGGLYILADSPIEKLFILFMFVMFILPAIISMVSYIFKLMLNNTNQKGRYTRQVDKNGNFILKPTNINNQTTQRTVAKVVTTEGYSNVKDLIVSCSKNKQLSRQTILELKARLRNLLGVYYEPYSKMNFSNDLHEIYVLLKSQHLSSSDYYNLYDFICQATQQRD